MEALKLQDLSFRYPGAAVDVLRGLTLEIPAGGVFGLLGPNGAGKTTLVSILAGQLRGASGRAVLDGSIGLVPQEHAFYPMLTCRENLRFFGGVQGLLGGRLKERIAAVAALARIESVLERRAGELSGGLKRRLNLAIGLLTEPTILLLDEPTVGVDPQSRAFLLETIRSLAGPQRVIVYTSHYMEEVQAICDRVAIIDRGEVLVSGLLSDILKDGSGLLTLRLRAPLPDDLAADWRLRYALRDDGDARYQLRISDALGITQALDAARAAGCEPLALAYGQRDLEQLFMQLTRRSLRD
jgi:ABC-2 type transport system ATP-binding protein